MKDKTRRPPLAYEPTYIAHRDATRRRKDLKAWLKRRERALDLRPTLPGVQSIDIDTDTPTRNN